MRDNELVVESSGDTQLTRAAPHLRLLVRRDTRGIYARPNALLHSGITQALGWHLSQYDLPASTHGAPRKRGHWNSPVNLCRSDRGSDRAIDYHGQSFAKGDSTVRRARADHAASPVTLLCPRPYRSSWGIIVSMARTPKDTRGPRRRAIPETSSLA